MNRYFIEFSFKGTNYHGWQIQSNARTVQLVMEDALKRLSGNPIKTTGAGRTDTGVHARHFTAHFDSDHPVFEQTEMFLYKINSILPKDIAVKKIYRVNPEAHARFSAISRTYEYIIRFIRDPFDTEYSWYFTRPLDLQTMNQAAKMITAYSDFTSFSKLHTDVKTNLCHIMFAEWREKEGILCFRVKADRFLRNMVRAMVGTMVEVGLGKINTMDLKFIMEGRDRNKAGFSVPAHGLFLVEIVYPDHIRL
jgi:tRNA pseudouridine38-40 synthase